MLYIASNALRHGARAGIAWRRLASRRGALCTFAAAVGVSALLAASSMAFAVLKWLGAAYLVYVVPRLLLLRVDRYLLEALIASRLTGLTPN